MFLPDDQPATASTGRRFHLLQQIGSGAFGVVYLAEQQSVSGGFRRNVALKVLHPHRRDEETSRRIRDEARILGRVSHRNVVTVSDLVRIEDRWAVVMEYVPGADVRSVLDATNAEAAPFPVAAALEIGAGVSAALHAVYTASDGEGGQLGILHRDIKPSNVRLTPDGDVKVLDFGIAWVNHASREAETAANAVFGTIPYMPPERIRGELATQKGDGYSTAKMVAELLLGESLGNSPAVEEAHARWLDHRLSRIEARLGADRPSTSMILPLLARSLSALPHERPDARELREQLEYLSRSVPGETLRAFSEHFVPRVPAILGRQDLPASGSLSESVSPALPAQPQSNHTTPLEGLDDPPSIAPPALLSTATPATPRSEAPSLVRQSAESSGVVFRPTSTRRPLIVAAIATAVALVAVVALVAPKLMAPPARTSPVTTIHRVVVETAPAPSRLTGEEAAETDGTAPQASAEAVIPGVADRRAAETTPRRAAQPSPPPVDTAAAASTEPAALPGEEPTESDEASALAGADEVTESTDAVAEVEVSRIAVSSPAPVVEPEPALVAPFDDFVGVWVGTASGRPVTLRITREAEQLVATGELAQGPTLRSMDLSGTVSPEGWMRLADARSDMRFEGRISGQELGGTWWSKAGGRALAWTTERQ